MKQFARQYLPFILIMGIFVACNNSSKQALPQLDLRVENFGLYDQHGNFHNLYYYSDASAIVLFVHGNGCPIVRNVMPALREVRDSYADKGVQFFMLNANLQDNRESIIHEASDFGIDFPIMVDDAQLVAEALDIHRTAEAIVIDPKQWKIVYRGPVDDRLNYETQKKEAKNKYLADALDNYLSGQPIAEAVVRSPGCLVALPVQESKEHENLTYVSDIAPILKANCRSCHQKGGIAPWAMDSYEMVRGWAPMMREVVRTRRMPPWQADPHYGEFSNDLSLTVEERQKIVHWAENGAPRGEGEDLLKNNPSTADAWGLGEPDLIIELDPQKIPATGVLDYRYFPIKPDLKEGKWVKAVEVKPGNYAALHHVLVSATYPDGFEAPMQRKNRWFDGLFATYAPGTEPDLFPEGSGRYLPVGTELLFQVHYTTTGKEEIDATKLGIYFSDEEPEKEFLIVGPANWKFEIPPEAKAHDVYATQVFDEEVTLYGLSPHMHFRGKSMKYTANYPDGSSEVLINVPNYNFNWQRYYKLQEPKALPAGTEIAVHAVFDNSSQNQYNPDPSSPVYFGEQSFEEMMIGYMAFVRGVKKEKEQLAITSR